MEEAADKPKEIDESYCSVALTSTTDGVITSDGNDRILTWNRGAERIFGYGPEIVHLPVVTLIPERYRKAHREGIRRFLATGEKRILGKIMELQALRKDGTEFPIELSLSSWQSSQGIRFGAIIRDISERKHLERMREQVHHILRHDLRSPLVSIVGLSKVLDKDGNLTERQRKATQMIRDLGTKMLKSMDRSRDLFQMEEGVYELDPRPVNLLEVLHRVRQEVEPVLARREVNLDFIVQGRPVEDGGTYRLLGDEDLLETMLVNLLRNALEASPAGSGVWLSVDHVMRGGRPFHVMDIHNEGVIPEDIRDRFMQPYVTSGKKGGSGLGAHSALLVAQAHQGTIDYTTSEEEGTHVVVRLPGDLTQRNRDA